MVWERGSEKCFCYFGRMFAANSCNAYGARAYAWVSRSSSFTVRETTRNEIEVRNERNTRNVRNVTYVRNVSKKPEK